MAKEGAPEGNKNAKKHGAYAFLRHGEKALVPRERSRRAELREIVQDRQGVLALMQEKAADSVLLFEIVQSYVAHEQHEGRPLGSIAVLRSLPAFMNSMQRALKALIDLMPEERANANAELERIAKVIEENDQKAK